MGEMCEIDSVKKEMMKTLVEKPLASRLWRHTWVGG